MMKKLIAHIMRSFLTDLAPFHKRMTRNDAEYENKRRLDDPIYLDRFGYKVFSQNDEDGIIAEIFDRIGITNKKFVEFGVQDGLESNGHFLLHKGWQGIWIDGDKKMFKKLLGHFQNPIRSKQLIAINAFITADNINHLIANGNGGGGGGGDKGVKFLFIFYIFGH
jgi:hypothetical protein